MHLRHFFPCILLSILFLIIPGCGRDKEYLPVPAGAGMIVKIDLSRLSSKIIWDKIGSFDLSDLFKEGTKDSLKKALDVEELLSHPGDAGIDYRNDVFVFQWKNRYYVLAQLKDDDAFAEFLTKNIHAKITSYQGHKYFTSEQLYGAWKKDLALFELGATSKNPVILSELLELKKEGSIYHQRELIARLDKEADIVVLSNFGSIFKEHAADQSPLSDLFSGDFAQGWINFEAGKIHIVLSDFLNKKAALFSDSIHLRHFSSLYNDSLIAAGGLSLDPVFIKNILDTSTAAALTRLGIVPAKAVNAITGELYFTIKDLREQVKTFRTYEVDDDFNTIEKTDSLILVYPAFDVLIPLRDTAYAHQILETITHQHLLQHSSAGYSFDLYDFPIYGNLAHQSLLVSDRSGTVKTFPGRTNDLNNYKGSLLFIDWNTSKAPYLLGHDVSGVEKIFVKMSHQSGTIFLESAVLFENKDQNGLLSLIGLLKQ